MAKSNRERLHADVFISYSRKDTELANKICESLGRAGISYFIDRQGIVGGAEFPEVLADAIAGSAVFLFIASKNSYESKYTSKEIHFAFNLRGDTILLPYIIDDSTLPMSLQFIFSDINILTMREHPIETVLIPDILELLGRNTGTETHPEDSSHASGQVQNAEATGEEVTGLQKGYSNDALRVTLGEWEEVKRAKDLFRVNDYRNNHPDSPFINDVNSLYYTLRDEKLAKMRQNLTKYTVGEVERLLDAGIFTLEDFYDEGLMTEKDWQTMQTARQDFDLMPSFQDVMVDVGPDFQSPADSTDVFFFGNPGAGGKTCLLMSLAGNNGNGYFMDTTGNGGKYAANLSQFYRVGYYPPRTYGRYCAAMHTIINGSKRNLQANFIEMSGEEFGLKLAENPEVSFSKLDTPVSRLLQNDNRKIFFLHFDPTAEKVKCEYVEPVYDSYGEIIDEWIKRRYVSQETSLSMFLSKLLSSENADIMRKVDAIHILVCKADMLGDRSERPKRAEEVIERHYKSLREGIRQCCNKYDIRNTPEIIPFSIGKFYTGDVFNPDPTDTLSLVDIVRNDMEAAMRVPFWKKIFR